MTPGQTGKKRGHTEVPTEVPIHLFLSVPPLKCKLWACHKYMVSE